MELKRAIEKGKELLGGVLDDYVDAMDKAYLKVGVDKTFPVSLSLKFSDDGGNIKVEAGISFVEGKVKDSAEATVSDQMDLPIDKGKGAKKGTGTRTNKKNATP